MKAYLNALFFAVRATGKTLRLPYRCDSPQTRRVVQMEISALPEQGLMVAHIPQPVVVAQNPKRVIQLADYHSPEKCSVCCAFRIGQKWIDPVVLPPVKSFPKGLGLCKNCKDDAAVATAQLFDDPKAVLDMRLARD